MNVTNNDLVLVRGINAQWFKENFSKLWIGFGGAPQAIPKEDAYYVGLYMGAPVSAITHIGIVESIHRYDNSADFYLKCIIKLKNPIDPGHPIRKHENWKLSQFGLSESQMDDLRIKMNGI
ncbi:hypothetical protein [Polaribacter atrinae]|uniref:Uncharacterized protein n=1 Tax=Polaribacter atrinae TaxID=1333662 RepID=A0A176TDT8_9FLAO|nr:hypothetical protein [Polaribacter atrinae]OAD46014.1 hypothetical protein LPB303_03605 [Polaribacter atrinae]